MVGEQLSLENVALEYPVILLDTSVLSNILGGASKLGLSMRERISIKERISIFQERSHSADFFRDFIENNGCFYVTQAVLDEYSFRSNYPYNKKIRKSGGRRSEGVLELRREKRDESKKRRNLIRLLEERERVLQLDENEEKRYNSLCRRYLYLKGKKGLSKTNFDFLISGAVVSEKRGPTCLISNTFKILHSWQALVRGKGITPEEFGFFLRDDINVFRRPYL